MKTVKRILTNKLRSLPTARVKREIRRKKKPFLIVNDFNPNDLFEVDAVDANHAAHAALAQLGWWIAEDR